MRIITLTLALTALTLTGCGSITGFSNAKTDFGCADLSGGPTCRKISDVYAENNPQNRPQPQSTVYAEEPEYIQPYFEYNRTDSPLTKTSLEKASVQKNSVSDVTSASLNTQETNCALSDSMREAAAGYRKVSQTVTLAPIQPRRKGERIMRVWLSPFKSGNMLHDQRYAYVKIQESDWSANTIEDLSVARSHYKPVYPLSKNEPAPKEAAAKPASFNLPLGALR